MKRMAIGTLTTASISAAAALMLALPAQANQPNMKAALASLNEAKQSLEKASSGKGGHRVKAIELIDEAIEQVKKGIKAGRM
jgi:hypothetical protein